jgi:uncharacterized small protein (DUF1192 family)
VLKAFLARVFSVSDSEATVPTVSLSRRVDELEERVDFLHGQIQRLRGAVTGALRRGDAQDAPESTIVPPKPPGVSPSVWARMTPSERERLLSRGGPRAVSHGQG